MKKYHESANKATKTIGRKMFVAGNSNVNATTITIQKSELKKPWTYKSQCCLSVKPNKNLAAKIAAKGKVTKM
jgi:hypothetical protein